MARLLEYLETPQYLRKKLFAMHPSLKHVGLLPPLDLPHHVRRDDEIAYREGVVETWDAEGIADKKGKRRATVDIGLDEPVALRASNVTPGLRVTVRLPHADKEGASRCGPNLPSLRVGSTSCQRPRAATEVRPLLGLSRTRGFIDQQDLHRVAVPGRTR